MRRAVSPTRTVTARWTRKLLEDTPALSIRQPWAWLIVNGYKDVEDRSRNFSYRGPLLIHASLSKQMMKESFADLIAGCKGVRIPNELMLGGVVGVVDVVDCTEYSRSPWHVMGALALVLKNPRRLPFRPCKGQLNIFYPEWE